MKNVRFNCMMTEETRQKLHTLALQNNRSDSNMITCLINEAFLRTVTNNKRIKKAKQNV